MHLQNKQQHTLLHQLFEDVWNQGKLDVLDDIFTEDILIHVNDQMIVGRTAWRKEVAAWRTAFPDMKYEILQIVYSDDKITCLWEAQGTHLGIFAGMFPTKHKVSYDGITIFHISHEKFNEAWVSPNLHKLYECLKLPSKAPTHKDFAADFSGPAGKIYQWIFKARTVPSCKQKIADALRDQFAYRPADNQPELIVPSELFEQITATEVFIPGKDGHQIRSLVYTPKNATTPTPISLYFHGGGWSIGSPEASDLLTRKLTYTSGHIVISVDYRLAPEHPYPAGLNDCYDFYLWARKNAHKLNGDPQNISVGGDSSGGNLALALTLKARDEKIELPNAVVVLCPLTDFLFEKYSSAQSLGSKGLIYDFAFLSYARSIYAPQNLWEHPYVSPSFAKLKNLCPVFLLAAGQDPLVDENKLFAEKLKQAHVPVEFFIHEEMPHAYYYFLGLTQEEDQAYQAISKFLKSLSKYTQTT